MHFHWFEFILEKASDSSFSPADEVLWFEFASSTFDFVRLGYCHLASKYTMKEVMSITVVVTS